MNIKNINLLIMAITTILPLFIITSCSSESSDSGQVTGENTPAKPFGALVDSSVTGIKYVTDSTSGATNLGGLFPFIAGESITFSIGDITLPTIAAKNTVSPLDIFSTTDINDTSVINLSRLLQTLDCDGDSENGIKLCDEVHGYAEGLSVDFSAPSFDTDVATLVATNGASLTTLVDANTAISHLNNTLSTISTGDVYYEIYGTTVGDIENATTGRTLLGTSRGGHVFNVQGFDRFILYVPSTSGSVKVDYLAMVTGGITESLFTSESEPIRTSSFVFPPHIGCQLGDGCEKRAFFYTAGDGSYVQNTLGTPAYINFTTRGADYLKISLASEGDSEIYQSDCDTLFNTSDLQGCFQLFGQPDGLNGFWMDLYYYSFDGAGSWSYLDRSGTETITLDAGEYSVRACTLTLCKDNSCVDHTGITDIDENSEVPIADLTISGSFYSNSGDYFCEQ